MKIPSVIFLGPNRVERGYKGGKILDALEGKKTPSDSYFPEDWIASTVKVVNRGRETYNEGISKIRIRDVEYLLTELLEDYGESILGRKHIAKYGKNMPFLVKLLDSSVRLNFQAHPDIPFARKYLHSNHGKTEAYIILGIRENITSPYIYLGFQKPPAREEWKEIILKQDIEKMESCFEKIPVKKGDVFVIPAGLPHAIGEGIFMVEIMEPTDFTVVAEFEKDGYVLPEEARFMGLGIDRCLDIFDYAAYSVEDIKKRCRINPKKICRTDDVYEEELISQDVTPYFSVNRINIKDRWQNKPAGSYSINIISKGKGIIKYDNQEREINYGNRFFVPQCSEGFEMITQNNSLQVIRCLPPL